MKKFYNFISNNDETELYLYGAITSEKWDDSDVTFQDFKDKIDKIPNNGTLNIYQNSGGGDCFVASSICSLLKRAKDRGIKVISTIDSLSASASSWISCNSDELRVYDHSIMMLHSPSSFVWGNAEDMRKEIEILDTIQNNVMIPIYMSKAKDGITEDMITDLINKESWLGADEIEQYFNVTRIEGETKAVASVDKELFANYKNVPSTLKSVLENDTEEVIVAEDNLPTDSVETIVEGNNPTVDCVVTDEMQNKIKLLDLELALL